MDSSPGMCLCAECKIDQDLILYLIKKFYGFYGGEVAFDNYFYIIIFFNEMSLLSF
jgi:hypothetical protein